MHRQLSHKFETKLKKFNAVVEKRTIRSGNKFRFYRLIKSRLQEKNHVQALRSPCGNIVHRDDDKAELLDTTFAEYVEASDDETMDESLDPNSR